MYSDAAAALAKLIAGVETALDLTTIREVIGEVHRSRGPALERLCDLIESDPTVLISGAGSMPRLLERIITALVARGATSLVRARCTECGKSAPLTGPEGGVRRCDACTSRANYTRHECVVCGETRARRKGIVGNDICRRCWRVATPDAATRLTRALAELLPFVPPSAVQKVVTELSANWQLTLAFELEFVGPDIVETPAKGSFEFIQLWDSLRSAGAVLDAPRCGACSLAKPLTTTLAGLRVCTPCYTLAQKKSCDTCHKVGQIRLRLSDGTRMCSKCAYEHNGSPKCSVCGEVRRIAYRAEEGAVCTTCRKKQLMDTCTQCGLLRTCRFAGTPQAICEPCGQKKPECALCGESKPVYTRDERGLPICHSCAPAIVEPCTDCGKELRVMARVDGAPYCGRCYKKNPVSFQDCARCGAHAYLNNEQLCIRCQANDIIDSVLPIETVRHHPNLLALRAACQASNPRTIAAAFKLKTSLKLLQAIVADPDQITHQRLDEMGDEVVTRGIRSLLVQHQVLQPRDEILTRFEAWIESTSQRISRPADRKLFRQFARWRHLKHLREQGRPVTRGQATSRRANLNRVVELLGWLEARELSLGQLNQSHLDRWMMEGPAGRVWIQSFLDWAYRNRRSARLSVGKSVKSQLDVAGIDDDRRWRLLDSVFNPDQDSEASSLFAAGLILLYGVQLHKIVSIKIDDFGTIDGDLGLNLGAEPLSLPPELARIAEVAIARRDVRRLYGTVQDHTWLFPGEITGHHTSIETLAHRLKKIGISPREARRAALAPLAMTVPPIVLSRLTGIHPTTANNWSVAVSSSNSRYVGERMQLARPSRPDPKS